jgi:hypothetical protein
MLSHHLPPDVQRALQRPKRLRRYTESEEMFHRRDVLFVADISERELQEEIEAGHIVFTETSEGPRVAGKDLIAFTDAYCVKGRRYFVVASPDERRLMKKAVFSEPNPPVRKPSEEGVIYFLLAEQVNVIKIGFARHVRSRVSDLQTASPVPLILLGTMAGRQEDEQALHRRFSSLRSHREWFRAEPELWEFVEQHATLLVTIEPADEALCEA